MALAAHFRVLFAGVYLRRCRESQWSIRGGGETLSKLMKERLQEKNIINIRDKSVLKSGDKKKKPRKITTCAVFHRALAVYWIPTRRHLCVFFFFFLVRVHLCFQWRQVAAATAAAATPAATPAAATPAAAPCRMGRTSDAVQSTFNISHQPSSAEKKNTLQYRKFHSVKALYYSKFRSVRHLRENAKPDVLTGLTYYPVKTDDTSLYLGI